MKPLHRLLVVAWTALLVSCGGGGVDVAGTGGGGVGTGGTGVVAGVVTGLGSVTVEDRRFDESRAALESRPDLVNAQPLALADLHIGQYAYLQLDAAGTPVRVRIEAQLVGPVAGVDAATGVLQVWGQPVAVNADPARGPVTVFSGFAALSQLQAGEPVQVYGVLQAGEATDVLRATRIEKLAAAGARPARVTGTLRQGTGGTLLLAGRPLDVSRAQAAPALAAGTAVIAVVPWTAELPATWQASAVALLAPAAAPSLRVSGAVHLLPGGRAVVQGVEVDLAALPQAERERVREGSYLTVQGRSRDDEGRRADADRIEPLPQEGRSADVRGSITAVAGPGRFTVRGQEVDASSASFEGGSAADLLVGAYVEVQGTQAAAGIVARRVKLAGEAPERAVLELTGTVQSVDSSSRIARLLVRDGRVVELVLPAGATLPAAGDTIRAAGYWDGTRLLVREFRQESSGEGSGEDR
jgi:hypothetical protein